MRKLLTLVLVSYLMAFTAPFVAMADDAYDEALESCYNDGSDCDKLTEEDQEKIAEQIIADEAAEKEVEGTDEELKNAIEAPIMCPFEVTQKMTIPYGTYTAEQKKLLYDNYKSQDQAAMAASYESSSCGEYNSYSGYYEKGDCSADGLIVTEITEVIAPNATLDDKNKIITTYGGLCCFAGEIKTIDGKETIVTCDDTRTLYTKTYTECAKVAVGCEKRQWVIGDSGIGIIQLMIKQIYVFGAFAVGTVAVSTMIFQGIKISVSGVSGDISDSKNKILQALSGIVLLFLSGLILYTINPDFFG